MCNYLEMKCGQLFIDATQVTIVWRQLFEWWGWYDGIGNFTKILFNNFYCD